MRERIASFFSIIRMPSAKRLWRIILDHKKLYLLVILLELGVTTLTLLFAETNRRFFDSASTLTAQTLSVFILVLILIALATLALSFLTKWFSGILNTKVVYQMRDVVITHIKRLPFSYHENKHSSHFQNILFHELEIFKNFIVWDVLKLVTLPVSFIFILLYLFSVDSLLGLVALLAGPLQLISNFVLKRRYAQGAAKESELVHQVFHQMEETLSGMREVKVNQLEAITDRKFKELCNSSVKFWIDYYKVTYIRELFKDFPSNAAYVVGIGFGGMMLIQGEIGVGGLIAFITLLDKTTAPFGTMVQIGNSLQQAAAGARKMFELLAETSEDVKQGETLPNVPPHIEFEKVSFSYEANGLSALNDVSFSIPKGSTIALVGPSGGGKSTLIKLLNRFYDPQEGIIKVNGRPLEEYSIESVRSVMTTVNQDIYLFDGTIRENIALGVEADEQAVIQAAQFAQAYEFIQALPQGMDSLVGERGVKLSHGQRQRIGIARAILKEAPFLILDEPTSALDIETEAAFHRDLSKWGKGTTKIIIAHRLSTIKEVDYVLFLSGGRIAEMGSIPELIALNSHFKRFWERAYTE